MEKLRLLIKYDIIPFSYYKLQKGRRKDLNLKRCDSARNM